MNFLSVLAVMQSEAAEKAGTVASRLVAGDLPGAVVVVRAVARGPGHEALALSARRCGGHAVGEVHGAAQFSSCAAEAADAVDDVDEAVAGRGGLRGAALCLDVVLEVHHALILGKRDVGRKDVAGDN